MNTTTTPLRPDISPSAAGLARMKQTRGEPLLFSDWDKALMIHFEVDAAALQRDVPFELDLWEGRAFVSLVAFTMRGMRPRIGGRMGAWLLKPIATHDFLNVRTYVRHDGEPGIHFLAEWLSNLLAVKLGPRTFGLPYRFGRIAYEHDWRRGKLSGRVEDAPARTALVYRAELEFGAPFAPCEADSLDEWLMERYSAFNAAGGRRRFFRVWHPPWPQRRVDVALEDVSLLRQSWPWFADARLAGANFSPGLREVWMGRPRRVDP